MKSLYSYFLEQLRKKTNIRGMVIVSVGPAREYDRVTSVFEEEVKMKFLPELRKFLSEHKMIYTVRGYNASRPAWVDVEDVGRCRRTLLRRIYFRSQLDPYVELSGFAGVNDWWSKIEEFVAPGQEIWLYKVEVRN